MSASSKPQPLAELGIDGPALVPEAAPGERADSAAPARRRLSAGAMCLAVLAGCVHAAGIAWPFDFMLAYGQPIWWLQPLSLVALVWLMHRATSIRQAAWLGWMFATAMQCATWWWLFISLHTYGGLAAPLAVIAIVGLAGFLALYYAAACASFKALAHTFPAQGAIVFAALWLMAELARVEFFTGFPWGEGGYAQLDGPFADLAKLIGVHGLTFFAAFFAAVLAASLTWMLHRPRSQRMTGVLAGLAAGVLLAAAASSVMHIKPDGDSKFTQALPVDINPAPGSKAFAPFSVTLLQGNIAQDQKFQGGSGIPSALDWYGRQLRDARTSLVVTPETALPMLPSQLPEGYLEALTQRFVEPLPGSLPTAALVGIPLGSSGLGYTNSVIGLKPAVRNADGKPADNLADGVYRYDKHHLVPFGEFVHPLFKWFLALVNMPLSDFNRGAVSQPSFDWQGQRIAPNICYEDLFGEELAVRFTDAAVAPTIFVNISNIAWFGNSIAIDQHLAISRMRAVEFERPMIRATNTGATVIIDHTGKVTHALERYTRGVLTGNVEGRVGITPYAWWVSRLGLWPFWCLCLTVVGWAIFRRRKPV